MRIKISLIAIAMLAGCATPTPKIQLTSTFNEAETREMLREGTNTIKGSALFRQRNGGIVTCAGNNVRLTPATAYAQERMRHIYGNANNGYKRSPKFPNDVILRTDTSSPFTHTHPRYLELARQTVCDAQGFFFFNNVADGDFFIATGITWEVVIGIQTHTQGGFLMQRVTVSDGEVKEIVLSR